jgi:hypothetical protein
LSEVSFNIFPAKVYKHLADEGHPDGRKIRSRKEFNRVLNEKGLYEVGPDTKTLKDVCKKNRKKLKYEKQKKRKRIVEESIRQVQRLDNAS